MEFLCDNLLAYHSLGQGVKIRELKHGIQIFGIYRFRDYSPHHLISAIGFINNLSYLLRCRIFLNSIFLKVNQVHRIIDL